MKKILIFASLLTLSACIYAGGTDILPQRNAFFDNFDSYPVILFDDNGPKLVKTEAYTEIEPKKNTIQRAYTGFSVFYDKTYSKSYYEDFSVKANKNGVMGTASTPSRINSKDVKRLLGEAKVDGVWYSLLPSDQEGFVWLIKEDGSVLGKMGQVKNGRLVVLNADFIVNPADLRFETIKSAKTEQTVPTTGFDIKYGGMNLGRMVFTVLDYSRYGKDSGQFENIYIKYKENENIKIYGVKIKVLFADEQKIDYTVLGY